MKNLKHLFLFLILISLTFANNKQVLAADENNYIYEGWTSYVGHELSGGIDHENVTEDVFWRMGQLICQTHVTCVGDGNNFCHVLTSVNPNDHILDQGFLDNSTTLMNDFVDCQRGLSNQSGIQSFNTIYNNTIIYRSVSWYEDQTMSFSIVPYIP